MQEFTGVLKNLQERVTVITSVMEAKEPLTAVMETLQELTDRVTVPTSPLELMNMFLKAPQEPPAMVESVLLSIPCRSTWAR